MRRTLLSSLVALGGAAVLLGLGQRVSAAVVISDSFTNNATDRASGKTLNGVAAESGNATWGAYRFVFTDDNAATSSNSGSSAWVDAPAITGVVTLEADVDPSTLSSGAWCAIYLTNLTTKGGAVYDNFQLMMDLNKNGGYSIYANGISNRVVKGSVTLNSGYNHLTLIYNPDGNKFSAEINGASVLSDHALGSFTPDIKTAGMFINGTGSTFDNFKLSVVPEPAAVGSLVIGGMLALKNRPERK